jgi:putative cardiolipin synthase
MRPTFARLVAAFAALVLCRPEASGAEPTAMTAGSQGVDATRLALAIAPHAAAHPGKSGIHALPIPSDAFAARVALAGAADRTLEMMAHTINGRLTNAETLHHDEFVITKLYRSA